MAGFWDYLDNDFVKKLLILCLSAYTALAIFAFVRMMVYNLREGIKRVWFNGIVILYLFTASAAVMLAVFSFGDAAEYGKWADDVEEYGRAEFAEAWEDKYAEDEGVVIVNADKYVGKKIEQAMEYKYSATADGVIYSLLAVFAFFGGAMQMSAITSCGLRVKSVKIPAPIHISYDKEKLLLLVYAKNNARAERVVKALPPTPAILSSLKYFIDEEPEQTVQDEKAPEVTGEQTRSEKKEEPVREETPPDAQ